MVIGHIVAVVPRHDDLLVLDRDRLGCPSVSLKLLGVLVMCLVDWSRRYVSLRPSSIMVVLMMFSCSCVRG